MYVGLQEQWYDDMVWYGMVLIALCDEEKQICSLVWLRKKKNSETKKGLVWTRPYNYKAFRKNQGSF